MLGRFQHSVIGVEPCSSLPPSWLSFLVIYYTVLNKLFPPSDLSRYPKKFRPNTPVTSRFWRFWDFVRVKLSFCDERNLYTVTGTDMESIPLELVTVPGFGVFPSPRTGVCFEIDNFLIKAPEHFRRHRDIFWIYCNWCGFPNFGLSNWTWIRN